MSQRVGSKPWQWHDNVEYKCISLYYGAHNGIYGRELQIYKMIKIKQWENKHNKRYLFRRYLNQYFI